MTRPCFLTLLPSPTVVASDSGRLAAKFRRRKPGGLLTDAEIAEDHVEQVFDIDGAGDAAEAAQRKAQVFRAQLGQCGGKRSPQRCHGFLERLAVTRAGP